MGERPTMDELRARVGVQGKRYGDMPGTGPEGTTCSSCAWLRYTGNTKRHYKCGKTAYTHGDATTIRVTSPSCRLYEPEAG